MLGWELATVAAIGVGQAGTEPQWDVTPRHPPSEKLEINPVGRRKPRLGDAECCQGRHWECGVGDDFPPDPRWLVPSGRPTKKTTNPTPKIELFFFFCKNPFFSLFCLNFSPFPRSPLLPLPPRSISLPSPAEAEIRRVLV